MAKDIRFGAVPRAAVGTVAEPRRRFSKNSPSWQIARRRRRIALAVLATGLAGFAYIAIASVAGPIRGDDPTLAQCGDGVAPPARTIDVATTNIDADNYIAAAAAQIAFQQAVIVRADPDAAARAAYAAALEGNFDLGLLAQTAAGGTQPAPQLVGVGLLARLGTAVRAMARGAPASCR